MITDLLDRASNAAWDCRSRNEAITTARAVLADAPPAEVTAAFAAWRRAVNYDGPDSGLTAYLNGRYRDRGDIGLSLMRAGLISRTPGDAEEATP